MLVAQVAEGAKARFRQLLEALDGSRPSGAKAVVWAATHGLRSVVPGLQEALARPPQIGMLYLGADEVAQSVREGFRIPAARPAASGCAPREGARLVGHVEEAMDSPLDGMMALWAEARLHRSGVRTGEMLDAVADALVDPEMSRRFGESLADAALGVPGARMPMMPNDLAFEFRPYGENAAVNVEKAFACAVGHVLEEAEVCITRRGALLEAARILGHVERRNGADIGTLLATVSAGWEGPDARAAFLADMGAAALGRTTDTAGIAVPMTALSIPPAAEASQALASGPRP